MRRFSIPASQMMAPFNSQGYSSTPWNVTQDASSITWSTETFAQNQNANAIRFGTLYNFRFDADQPPNPTNATVGYFKTGSPTSVVVQAAGNVPLPSPTPTPTASPSPTATATPTPQRRTVRLVISYNSDKRQHRAGHRGHRQSRG